MSNTAIRGICKIIGCGKPHRAYGYCNTHYARLRRTGDAEHVTKLPVGSTFIHKGYKARTVNGIRIFEHVAVAERALGKPLPPKAVVHHADENPLNNEPSNLVICPNNSYHLELHRRMRAYDACGHAGWRKCPFCKQYDDPKNMKVRQYNAHHVQCQAIYDKQRNSARSQL